jgi:hypothetical protein
MMKDKKPVLSEETKNLMFKEIERLDMESRKEFYHRPEEYLPLDEVGDLHIQWFYDRYCALRLLQKLPLFNRAYDLLVKRGNFSRHNAFGEMHCDGYMWVEKCDHSKIIVEERQSYKMIFIYGEDKFHIRELDYKWAYPPGRRGFLRELTLKKFKDTNFKTVPDNRDSNPGFWLGDSRDKGYIVSMDMFLPGREKIDRASQGSLAAINSIDFWEHYIDNPNELE